MDSVLPEHGRNRLDRFETELLRDEYEVLQEREHVGTVKPYMDRILEKNHVKYVGFLKELFERGLLQWTIRPVDLVALFFVHKKQDMLRFILDVRRPNGRVKTPPGVVLAGAESFANLEVEGHSELWSSDTDIENCFFVCVFGNILVDTSLCRAWWLMILVLRMLAGNLWIQGR